MKNRNTNAYQRNNIMGKSPVELVVTVYDGAIAAYGQAEHSYQQNEYEAGYEHLEKAKRFVTHLYVTLDLEKGGEIAENLSRLYTFIVAQTDIAEATKDCQIINDNIGILKNLRDAWDGISQSDLAENNQIETDAEASMEAVASGLSITG